MDTQQTTPAGFAAGRFFCRPIPPFWESLDDVEIDDPIWEDDRQLLLLSCSDLDHKIDSTVEAHFGDTARVGSWWLARLWRLTGGAVRGVLGNGVASGKGEGHGDGGSTMAGLLVLLDGRGVAVLDFEIAMGDRGRQHLSLHIPLRGAALDPAELSQALAETLCAQPRDLATCRIVVRDPENNAYPCVYGWDGARLLGSGGPTQGEEEES